MQSRLKFLPCLLFVFALEISCANAAVPTYRLTLRDQQFQPAELTVPAHKKLKLNVRNADKIVAEFESYDLRREKVIVGNSAATLYIGPLAPGSYQFFNDFHQQTTGRIIAR